MKLVWYIIIGLVIIIYSFMGSLILMDDLRGNAICNIEKEFEKL